MLAQANALTQARYDFNPIEKRCLYQIIREVRRLFIRQQYRATGFIQQYAG